MGDKVRSGKYYFWRVGDIPLENVFAQRFCDIHGSTYDEAYNSVMRVMVVLQDMLLTHQRFMLPGIGIIGLARNPKRGITLASSSMWWTPGLLNVLAAAPGWENAPLNGYITNDLFTKINKIISKLATTDRKMLTPNQFYRASDFNLDADSVLSDEKLKYYAQASDAKWVASRKAVNIARRAIKTKSSVTINLLTKRVKYLESMINVPIEDFDLDISIKEELGD